MQRARIYVSDPTERCMGTGKFGKGKDPLYNIGAPGNERDFSE
jgi:hypothetical protein